MGGERWKESKYVYVIGALQASVFQIRDLMRDALRVITDLFHSFAYMSDSTCDYVIDRPVDQGNLHVLNPMYKSHCSVVDPRYTKQKTDLWHVIRGQAKVSGSMLYSAIVIYRREPRVIILNIIHNICNRDTEENTVS